MKIDQVIITKLLFYTL